ncbi:hypothetical protein PO909_020703, partial [Leuciscus waleckii]
TIARYISEINLKLFACAFVENSFDPAKIASKLRELGDDYDEKVIQPLMKNVQRAAADQVVTVFTDSVDSMCKMWVVERAEVASEKQLLKAAITLGVYVKETCPDMTNVVEVAMTGFINNRLTNWIAEQGGWVRTVLSDVMFKNLKVYLDDKTTKLVVY